MVEVQSWTPKYVIISIDGGGIRGLIPGILLREIEKRIQEDYPEHLIADHVDMLAGTSTGGILSIGLANRIPTSELVKIYEDEGKEKIVFRPPHGMSDWIPDFIESFGHAQYSNGGL